MTNRISAEIGRARDGFILEQAATALNMHRTTMLVFGESHLMILRPAFTYMLGDPCYVGNDMKSAAAACR